MYTQVHKLKTKQQQQNPATQGEKLETLHTHHMKLQASFCLNEHMPICAHNGEKNVNSEP